MIDLVMGSPLSENSFSHYVQSFYEGLGFFESRFHKLTVFNLGEESLGDSDIKRIKKLVLLKKANCILMTN